MNSLSLAKTLRANQDEVIRRWLDNLNGHIAEDFEQMLRTSMGMGVATTMLAHAVEFLEAEDYEQSDILRRVRSISREASFRRSAVGFSLQDIVYTALAFRRALEETLMNHAVHSGEREGGRLLEGILALNHFGDKVISGEIAGYFAYHAFRDEEGREVA